MEEKEMATQMEMFSLPKDAREITIKDLDRMVETLALCRAEKAKIEETKKEAQKKVQEAENILMEALDILDKKSYRCEGVGTITRVDKLSVKVPAFPEDKAKMFDWITTTLGAEAYWAYATVNSQSLNKLFNEQTAEAAEKGQAFSMPGVDMPVVRSTLSFRSN